MKIISKLIFFAIAVSVIYFFVVDDNGSNIKNQVTPAGQNLKVAPVVKKQTVDFPGSISQRMTPNWPPTQSGNDIISLASSLTQKNFVLILDGSGSMGEKRCSGELTKSQVAKKAVVEWSESVLNDANLGLIVFDQNGFSVRLPLGSGNRDQFRAEVDRVIPDYKTPLTKSLDTAYAMLTEQSRSQLGYGEYTVVIVTDGVANDIKALEASVNRVLEISPITIHTIGFCIASNHSLNREGRTVYRAANNPAELRKGLQEVLAESESFDLEGFE